MKTKEITISSSYNRCSTATYVSVSKADARRRWIKDRDLFMAELEIDGTGTFKRVVTPVTIKNVKDSPTYMMDAVTGSLYDMDTGECLTSDHIRMTDFVFRKNLGAELAKLKLNSQGDTQ